MTDCDASVGIVGAGPIGLACANRLASFGIDSLVLEAEPELVRQGSKACLIQGDVLEILDKFGCAECIAGEGVTWHVGRTYVRGQEIACQVYPKPLGFGPFTNISQYRIQQVLLSHLKAGDQGSVRWNRRVTAVAQDGEGVTVEAETPGGPQSFRFRYLVASDGVRSQLRDLVGVAWTGYTHSDPFLITDIRADLRLAHERHFHYDPPFNPGRELVIHAQPDSVWRIDWQLAPEADIEAERASGGLERRIRAVIGDVPYEVLWMSTYRFHQQVVDQFRVGRVFFAGDAAHALPPYGARGMNSGIQDVDNLAWKLWLVLCGRASDGLLDTYHTERYAAALENLRVTEATIRFMVPPSILHRLAKALLLRAALPFKRLRRRVNSGTMAEPYVYTESPLVQSPARSPLVGRFAPDAMIEVDGRRTRLRRQFGERFVLLYLALDASDARRFLALIPSVLEDLPLRVITATVSPEPVDGSIGLPRIHLDGAGGLGSVYAASNWYLLRPDGHVAASDDGRTVDPERMRRLLLRCTGCVERVQDLPRQEAFLDYPCLA